MQLISQPEEVPHLIAFLDEVLHRADQMPDQLLERFLTAESKYMEAETRSLVGRGWSPSQRTSYSEALQAYVKAKLRQHRFQKHGLIHLPMGRSRYFWLGLETESQREIARGLRTEEWKWNND